jgi:hypothetical protein
MKRREAAIAREAKAMNRKEVILKAIEGRLTWMQAATVLGLTPRQVRRLRARCEEFGYGGLRDGRAGTPRRKRIPAATIAKLCKLKREKYPDFSVRHFYEFATEKHGLEISYTWALLVLQEAGLVERMPGRGKYRRHRERRPMRGMLLHLDGSTHEWIGGLPKQDLMVMLDDADGRMLYACFVPEEGTLATLAALKHVLRRYGRFCELYTDRASHFCQTTHAAAGPDDLQNGQVPRVLKVLGIHQILARSPQARGRSERAFGTIQGRLPMELRAAGVRDYDAANDYLQRVFQPSFNRRFTVKPTESETAFVRLAGIDLDLLLSVQHQRIVTNDNTVSFRRTILQLPQGTGRAHFVRCPVLVHEFPDGSLGVSYQGSLLARYTQTGDLITRHKSTKKAA